MLTQTFQKIIRALLWMITISIAFIALTALVIHFYIFPNINKYKDDIAQKISQQTKLKVDIGEIKVDWKKLDPHLTLSNITVFDTEQRPALKLNNTEVLISWLSIPKMQLHLAELRISQPSLTIRRLKSGDIYVAGLKMRSQKKPTLSNWILNQQKVKIRDANVVWVDEMRDAPALSLHKLNLDFLSPPWKSFINQHRLAITATPSIGTKQPFKFMSEFYGSDVRQINQWYGDVSLRLNNAHIPDFKAWLDYPIQLLSANGNATIHADFNNLAIQKVTALVDLKRIHFNVKPTKKPIKLDYVKGKVVWDQHLDQHYLNVEGLDTKLAKLQLKDVNAHYQQSNTNQQQKLSLSMSELNLKSINGLLDALPVSEKQFALLTKLSPTGQLKGVKVTWDGTSNKTKHYSLKTAFDQLKVQAHEKIPGFTNLSGKAQLTEAQGQVTLNAKNASLNFAKVLRQTIPNNTLNGKLSWQEKNHKKQVTIDKLSIKNPHLSGNIKGKLLLNGKATYSDITGTFNAVDVSTAQYYFPKFLKEKTLRWLDNAFISGTGENVQLTLKGKLNEFPFVDQNRNLDLKKGLFRVTSKVKNGVIHYGNGWPNIDSINLDMHFEGERMVLSNASGNVLGSRIEQATITIPQLKHPDPMLHVIGNTSGPVRAGILFINQSPVSKVTQGFTDNLNTLGEGKLNLQLDIPLKHARDAKVHGEYVLENGFMDSDLIPAISNIKGKLTFTEKQLFAQNIEAIAYGQAITGSVKTNPDKSVNIHVDTTVNDQLLQHFVNNPAHYITGDSPLTADISVKKPNVNIALRSDLTGITSYLPTPLNKSAETPMNLFVEKTLTPNQNEMTIDAGQILSAAISTDKTDAIKQLNLYLDENKQLNVKTQAKGEPQINGIHVYGNLKYLNADEWKVVIKDLFTSSNGKNNNLSIQTVQASFDQLDSFGRSFNQVKIQKAPNAKAMTASIQSEELSGDIEWNSEGNGHLKAKLQHLAIPAVMTRGKTENPLFTPTLQVSNTTIETVYPSIDIHTDQFNFKGQLIGALDLMAKPEDDNWNIEQLTVTSPDSTLKATGKWTNVSYTPSTQFDIQWDIDDLGKTLSGLGHPDTIKDGKGYLKGQLEWAGSPHQFDTLALNGNLKFDMRKGQILKVKPGVGRLLGLVSLQSLPRRLTLDFRDLFSNGFAFDKIKSHFTIESGILKSDNFKMAGPAAEVKITGETNLKEETQQFNVKVFPHISDSLSLAALAGGPLAGAVAFLAQKVLKDPLNKIISTEYDITGTWDEPVEIKKEKNTENSVESIIN